MVLWSLPDIFKGLFVFMNVEIITVSEIHNSFFTTLLVRTACGHFSVYISSANIIYKQVAQSNQGLYLLDPVVLPHPVFRQH